MLYAKTPKPHSGRIRTIFQKPKIIFVDVDGTLIHPKTGEANTKLVEMLKVKKSQGFQLFLWSMRGETHARTIASKLDCTDLFNQILPKPGYVVDDKAWRWVRDTQVIKTP